MKAARITVVLIALALVLGLANWDIAGKRRVVADGAVLLLELAPVDPRSLFQGDYMALALADDTMPDAETIAGLPYRGAVILTLDAQGIGRFARLDDGAPPKPGEIRVQYRRHKDRWRDRLDYGAQAFFFQEGDAALFDQAKYAVLRVAADGGTVLTDLADKDRRPITPAAAKQP